jgi:geranylgeranyl reductase family protein
MNKDSFPQKAEVLIVGGGPTGSSLAYPLAQMGIQVVVIDKARFPRGKTCAGGLNLRTVRLFPFDLAPVVEKVITGISFSLNMDNPFTRHYPEPLLVTVRRENLDHFLICQAEKAGAHFFEEIPFLSLQQENDSVRVETSMGTCAAKFVIGADGAHSAVAKKLGLMQDISHILAIHSEVPNSLFPSMAGDVIHIDWGSLKRGYAYLFPKKNALSLGAGGVGISPAQIKNYQRAFLSAHWQKDETPPFSTAGFLLPLRRKRQPIHLGRCLLLGDAAGLIDPFSGEGLYSGVRSAQIVGPMLAESLKRGGDSLTACEEAINREIMPELECSRLFRELFMRYPTFFHRRIAESDRWWNAMAKILRGEKSNLDLKEKMGVLGNLLLRLAR